MQSISLYIWMYSVIKTFVASFLIIFIIDNLINYLKNTYTTRKTKDVVSFHIQKYQTIMDMNEDLTAFIQRQMSTVSQ